MPFTSSKINVKESAISIYFDVHLGLQTLKIKENNTKFPDMK